jgi:exopolyphosphatase / guanosine-5'-triphosphate,3'-diphosphate pyrophosphatase
MSTYAVIDLGSNTFHILIIKVMYGRWQTVFRQRDYTFLSDGGGQTILQHRMDHARSVINNYTSVIDTYRPDRLRIVGTAVMRTATNSQALVDYIQDTLHTPVEIVDGQTEANLIYKGIISFDAIKKGTHIVMDIGGGSTEFIILVDGDRRYSQSFPLGVGKLFATFKTSDPIHVDELERVQNHLIYNLSEFITTARSYRTTSLIGTSGSFEVLISLSEDGHLIPEHDLADIPIERFRHIYDTIIKSNTEDRSQMKGMPAERVRLSVLAMVLKNFIVQQLSIDTITFCPYALKEGVLAEMIDQA